MGAQKGQVLAMFLPNCMEFPIVFGGATNAGLPVTTMNPIYKSTEIARQLKMSKAKWAVTNKELLPVMQEAISKLDEPKENWKDRVIIVENEPSKYSRFIFKSKFSQNSVQNSVLLGLKVHFLSTLILLKAQLRLSLAFKTSFYVFYVPICLHNISNFLY